MPLRVILLVVGTLTWSSALHAASDAPAMPLQRIDTDVTPVIVDGHLHESFWHTLTPVEDFLVLEPDTLQSGKHPTRFFIAYDDGGIYFGAEMEQPKDTLVGRLTGRDGFTVNRDHLSITLDTSGEGRYGYWFGVSLGDSLMDGTVLPERKYSNDWDGPWRGRSQVTDYGWSAEFYIPWSVVSMPHSGEVRKMGIYASRKVAYLDERWGWPSLPPTTQKFMSSLQQLEMRDVAPKQQYNVYPFVAAAHDAIEKDERYRAGLDVFWRPSTNFQMNATVNPDFGNVESDEVVINLTALEVFFPEKRLFFLEGQEVYVTSPRGDTRGRGLGNQGVPYTLLNTRRIGGSPRRPVVGAGVTIPQRELVEPTELLGAVNTTGQIGRLRYGVLAAFEDDVKFHLQDNGISRNIKQDGNDYGVARLLYEDAESGAYRALGVMSTAVLNDVRDAKTYGVDGHYLAPSGKFKVDAQYMGSDVQGLQRGHGGFIDTEILLKQGMFYRVGLEGFNKHLEVNDLGFLQRVDMYRFRSSFTWTIANLGFARENQFDLRGFLQKNISESLLTGAGIFLSDRLALNDLSTMTLRLNIVPDVYDDLNSFGNGTFRIENRTEALLLWESDTTRRWFYTLGAGYKGENLGGDSWTGDASIAWRPSDRFGVSLAVHYEDRDGWLLHQQDRLMATFAAEQWTPSLAVDYFISARQQLRLSLQFVGIKAREQDFFLIPGKPGDLDAIAKPTGAGFRPSYDFSKAQYSFQLRYRWEIAPLSDLFLVYTRQADRGALLTDEGFPEVFQDAWDAPLADVLVLKVRYRLGS